MEGKILCDLDFIKSTLKGYVFATMCRWIGMLNFYNILGVPENATKEQIKKAYREQIKFFHPDVFQGNPEVAKEKTIQLNAAYETLMNDVLRKTYDENLKSEKENIEDENNKGERKEEEFRENENRNDPPNFEEDFLTSQMKKAKHWKIVAIILAVIMIYGYFLSQNKIESLEADYFAEITDLQNDLTEKTEEASKLRLRIYDLNQNQDELNFWRNFAVIVTEYGEKYHTYGCQYIENKNFWIYNIGAAIGKGYEPCSVCNPPVR